ncbi:sodium/potassium/calcium exchanger 2 [Rhineura floridana]|uniref:sodium/potassium/calcium exchanger 2 n=1 Tax=Rhineura floridana TaxID=261503 RepID=UPI002AC7EA9A|nr:sodium/potassium/calcium exchanger 2 [Rhineura floridana]
MARSKSIVNFLEELCLQEPLLGYKKCQNVRKKLRLIRITGIFLGIMAISILSLSISAFLQLQPYSTEAASNLDSQKSKHMHQRTLLDFKEQNQNDTPDSSVSMKYGARQDNHTEEHSKGEYPEDLFSLEERRRGAVILHVFGMVYMFIALAVVCDEFFVPSLTVITEKLGISDDVAGATFMAAGGSAPELFTSLIGVFISHSNVGIGTIVGSAVFNILFVIGMCALFSKEILRLTWWPLFRDVTFYIMDLILLIIFFLDNVIMWWESLTLLTAYMIYVTFMKFNVQLEACVKKMLNKNKVEKVSLDLEGKVSYSVNVYRKKVSLIFKIVLCMLSEAYDKEEGFRQRPKNLGRLIWEESNAEDDQMLTTKPRLQRGGSSASLHNSLMRNSIFQLMIHTLDPLAEGKFKERASILHKMAKKCQVEDGEKRNGSANHAELPNSANVEVEVTPPNDGSGPVQNGNAIGAEEEEEDDDQPLNLAWPDTPRKQLTYLIIFPIVFPLWITLPDVRNHSSKKFFPFTFFGSISWIAVFSYLMVWWAHQVGETIGISEEIMGLTILAAGTSIPDLITSVIVARKGLGDMAVSSSVGSNIFDITVGLPLPWLLYASINKLTPVTVSSNGLFCAIVLLFIMLLFVILSIATCKWRMNKFLGFTMFGLYFIFLIVSVLLEDRIIVCPVSI